MFKKVMHILMLMAILAGLFSLTPATSARAAGLCYVNDDAAGSNNGTSWTNAYTSLQSAIADTCTEIWVAAGTYKPHASDRDISFNLQTGTAIYGGFAGTETLLSQRDYVTNVTILSGDLNGNDSGFTNNGENSYHVVYASIGVDSTSILDGFRIESGNANGGFEDNNGGGMYINIVSPTLNNLTFSTNSATSNGGGLHYTGTNAPALTNITFSNNSAAYGGGMHAAGSPVLNNIIFSSNIAANDGGGLYNSNLSSPSLSNVTFTANTAANGGGMFNLSANPTLSMVTFSGNSATSAGGGVFNNLSTSASFTKVTFSGNSAAGGGGMLNFNSTPILNEVTFLNNSATTDGGGMSNQFNGNPTLTNVTFSGNSATDDGGGMYNYNSSYPILTNVTFSSNTVTSSGGGLYNEFNSSPTLVNVIIANSTNGDCVNAGSSIDVDSSNNLIENTFASGFSCGLSNGSNGNIIGSDPNLGTLTGSPAYFPLGVGSLAINAGTNTGCPSTSQNGITRPQSGTCDIGSYELYDYTNLTLYVKPVATGLGNCLTWANACTLQTAISVANSGNEIWVMQGTYTPHVSDRTVSFALETGVEIYGGFAGTETLLSQRNYATNVTTLSGDLNGNDSGFTNNAENSYHVVTSFGVMNSAILDGFTISGGNANGSTTNRFGGGMYNASTSSPTLNNLTFTNNYGEFGGGMLNENASAPAINNITFTNNSAASGGGMANYSGSTPTLTNATFSGNTANFGGGLLNYLSNPTLTNVTFSGNTSGDDGGGGMYNYGNTPILKNVIIANSTNGGDCVLDGGATIHATSSNNLIEGTGGYTCDVTASSQGGGNIIGSDPDLGSLTGSPAYFPLNTGSLATNAGTNTGCPATDQRGVTRPFGTQCDIGSFEANPTPLPTGWVGSVSVTSNKNLVSVGRPHIGSEVASYDGFSSGSTTAFVPMLFKDAFGGDYDAALYIQNVSGSSASVTIQYYDSSGVLNCTKADTIAPLASKGYWLPAATCDTGSLPTGWVGGVKVTSNHPIVAVGRPHIGSEVMTYNGFSSGSTSAFIPMLFKGAFGGSYNAAFYVQNVSGSSANVTLEYFDNTGTLNCTKSDTIASLASKGYWLPAATCDTGSLPAGWVGGVRVSSSQPVVTVGRPHIDTQITTYDGFSAGANSAYVPMLFKGAFGGSYNAAFYLQNVSNSSASVTIKYYDNAGTLNCTKADTIAPLASKGYWLPAATCDTGSLPAGWVGGVEVTSDQPIVSVGRPHIDAQVTTYNGFTAGATDVFLPMLFKDAFGGSYDSAFYLQNTEATAATVTIQFYDSTGALTCSRSDTIQPRATLGFWVPSATCFP